MNSNSDNNNSNSDINNNDNSIVGTWVDRPDLAMRCPGTTWKRVDRAKIVSQAEDLSSKAIEGEIDVLKYELREVKRERKKEQVFFRNAITQLESEHAYEIQKVKLEHAEEIYKVEKKHRDEIYKLKSAHADEIYKLKTKEQP